jgi:hypothetical protein
MLPRCGGRIKCVGGVVSQIEAAFHAELGALGIGQAQKAGSDESGDFALGRGSALS